MAMGLYLMYLLACDRIKSFHTELESLTSSDRLNAYIHYPIQLERYLMEGNYAKLLGESRPKIFDKLYTTKMQEAVHIRQAKAHEISCSSFETPASSVAPTNFKSEAMGILSNMVSYAVDLERIV
jgi:hypothetical protein